MPQLFQLLLEGELDSNSLRWILGADGAESTSVLGAVKARGHFQEYLSYPFTQEMEPGLYLTN